MYIIGFFFFFFIIVARVLIIFRCVFIEFGRVHVNFGQKPFAFDLEARYDSPPFASFCLCDIFPLLPWLSISAYYCVW